jgi:hypothetical protein
MDNAPGAGDGRGRRRAAVGEARGGARRAAGGLSGGAGETAASRRLAEGTGRSLPFLFRSPQPAARSREPGAGSLEPGTSVPADDEGGA